MATFQQLDNVFQTLIQQILKEHLIFLPYADGALGFGGQIWIEEGALVLDVTEGVSIGDYRDLNEAMEVVTRLLKDAGVSVTCVLHPKNNTLMTITLNPDAGG